MVKIKKNGTIVGQIKHNWENKKDLLTQEKHVNYCYYLVPGVGIEPTQRQAPRDFKSYLLDYYDIVWCNSNQYYI
jgi:hypothetical protein